jgi:hypothetical protein
MLTSQQKVSPQFDKFEIGRLAKLYMSIELRCSSFWHHLADENKVTLQLTSADSVDSCLRQKATHTSELMAAQSRPDQVDRKVQLMAFKVEDGKCTCRYFQEYGLPCRHLFRAN